MTLLPSHLGVAGVVIKTSNQPTTFSGPLSSNAQRASGSPTNSNPSAHAKEAMLNSGYRPATGVVPYSTVPFGKFNGWQNSTAKIQY